jgi:hypothetical protein
MKIDLYSSLEARDGRLVHCISVVHAQGHVQTVQKTMVDGMWGKKKGETINKEVQPGQ